MTDNPTPPPEVKDTYLVGAPDLKAMSGDTDSDRVIKLHFRRPVNDKDREWLLEAINAKILADRDGLPAAEVQTDSAITRFQKRIVEMIAEGTTRFGWHAGPAWSGMNVEQRCAAILEVWDAKLPSWLTTASERGSE